MSDPGEATARVRSILGTMLDRHVEPGDPVSRETEPSWDSLKNIEIIFAIEDAFGIRFPEADLGRLTSLPQIVEAVLEAEGEPPP